jgi:hypothetical protein
MSFGGSPAVPAVPPPPPAPATMASSTVQDAGAAARQAAAAAAGGMGFAGTLQSGPQGAAAPNTALKQLLGS